MTASRKGSDGTEWRRRERVGVTAVRWCDGDASGKLLSAVKRWAVSREWEGDLFIYFINGR